MQQPSSNLVRLRAVAILLIALAFTTGAVIASPTAVSNGCMEDLYNEFGQGGTLNCTANDIQIASVTDVTITDDGCAFAGDTVTFNAMFEVKLTAQTRHDVGIYLAQDGGDALSGSCLVDTLPFTPNNEDCTGLVTPDACCTGDGTGTCEFLDVDNLDDETMNTRYCSADAGATVASPAKPCNEDADCAGQTCEDFSGLQDLCGDIVDNSDPRNPVFHTITGITVTCTDTDSNGVLDVAACTSWRQPGANELCLTPMAAFPGAPSKCRCEEALEIPIPVPQIIEVVKDLTPSADPGRFNLLVDGVVEETDAADGGTTGAVFVSSSECTSGGCLCSVSGTTCADDSECSGSVCTESLANNGKPLSCTEDADCNRTGVCEETQQGNSPKACLDVSDCDTGDRCLMSLSDVCQVDSCRDFTHTVGEAAGTSTDLDLYEKSISCVDQVGRCTLDPSIHCVTDTVCDSVNSGDTCNLTPTEVASCTDCTSADLTLVGPANIVCTITNELIDPCAGVDCSGLNDACNTGVCVAGVCQAEPKPDSTPCEDGDVCTSETGTAQTPDHCSAGVCTGVPVDCSGDDDQCNVGTCNAATGACFADPVADSTPCEDGDVCTSETGTAQTPDHCSAGVCTGVPVDCSGDDDQCNVGTCNAATGACFADPVADSTPCEDGDVCTSETGTAQTPDHCSAGVCTGVPVDCSGDDDQCNVGTCNAATGACFADPVADSTPCEDGDVCTSETGTAQTPDHCSAGVCTGVPVDCSGDDDQCNVGTCNAATGACFADPVADSTPCEDGDVCTSETGTAQTPDHCSAGVCTGVPVDCSGDDDQCNVGTCNAATGACFADPVADSTPCEDGDVCTSETGTAQTPDHCSAGVCTGVPVDCSGDDDQCNVGTCNAATGACFADPVADSTPCEDGDVCTSETGTAQTPDHCSAGVCTGVPVDCSGDDDQCNVGTCNAATGACFADPVADSTPCEDGDVCTSETGTAQTPDHCSAGVCTGVPVDCSGDDDQCNVGTCNAATGACFADPVADSTPCEDGDVCTSETGTAQTPDHCSAGVCTGVPVDCSGDDDQCNVGTCDSTSGVCFADPVPNSTPCDDDSFCTSETGVPGTPDHCVAGVCTGDPVDCSDDTSCTVDTCDETNNTCISEPRDSLCDDDQFCNGFETCDPTSGCVNGTPVTCDDQDSCTVDTCDDDVNVCLFTLDDDACTGTGVGVGCTVLRLALNQNIFVSDETLILWLSVLPGPDPVDLYFQWVTPEGLVFFITSDGSLLSTPEPYYRSWMPEELDTEEIFRIIFTDEPEGEYSIRGVATVPGTALRAATSNEVSFTVVVGESDE